MREFCELQSADRFDDEHFAICRDWLQIALLAEVAWNGAPEREICPVGENEATNFFYQAHT